MHARQLARLCIVFAAVLIWSRAVCAEFFVDITAFGADPSGNKDSSAAIQTAIASATSMRGASVLIPAGQYHCNTTLSVSGSSGLEIRGVSPTASILIQTGSQNSPLLLISHSSGIVLSNFGLQPSVPSASSTGLFLSSNFLISVRNLYFLSGWGTAFSADSTGNLDVESLNIRNHVHVAVRITNVNGDSFFSKIHADNTPSKAGYGLYLTDVSGAKFTDSDFLGGMIGVLVDGTSNQWLQFTSVDADTVADDAWHFEAAQGLQMSECWSGTFVSGTGIWLGPNVQSASISNHQWENGLIGIGNNSPRVVVTGGIMGMISETPISSNVEGQPVVSNVLFL
eukprot:ANDGO_01219.mRNA.1 hypothetical protein